ncbi:MAG: N-acetylmuramoyl-L-alanine amidase [Fimbriimonadaceae bacterium]|nr:N-acetylmuramoyl-L-alanine amidase [Fimbriimonadaceae bacterium]
MSVVMASIAVQGALGADIPDPRDATPNPWKDPGYNRFLWIQSPNFNARPAGAIVDTVVIHSTVIPTLEATTRAFSRESSQVSAHFTIGRDGSFIMHVSTFERAWHAGVSTDAEGRKNLNDFSIGIELVNLNDGVQPYPDEQVQVLKNIINGLRRRFPIRQLVSHEYIAVPSGRKSDPKGFPWEKLKDLGLPMFYGPKPGGGE